MVERIEAMLRTYGNLETVFTARTFSYIAFPRRVDPGALKPVNKLQDGHRFRRPSPQRLLANAERAPETDGVECHPRGTP